MPLALVGIAGGALAIASEDRTLGQSERKAMLRLLRIACVTTGGVILGWLFAEKYFVGSWIPLLLGGILGFLLGASDIRLDDAG